MTEILIESGEKNGKGYYLLKASGHSSSTESCNYICGILYALAGAINTAYERGDIEHCKLYIDSRSPYAEVECAGHCVAEIKAYYDMALIGLLQLQLTDPDALYVKYDGFDREIAE